MRHWLACCLWGDGDPGETSPPPVRGTAEPLKRLPTNALVAQAECSTNIETHLSLRHGLRRMSWGEHDSSLLYAFVWCFHILCRTFKMLGMTVVSLTTCAHRLFLSPLPTGHFWTWPWRNAFLQTSRWFGCGCADHDVSYWNALFLKLMDNIWIYMILLCWRF